jgi:hypothetical protein
MLFSRRLSDTEIGAYLDSASSYELAAFRPAAWPDVSSREAGFLADLVRAHRRFQQQV